MNTTIPAYALDVLISLESAGFEAYPVGGCVRDMLLGKAPHDFDVCTNASPEQTISALSGFTTIPTGLKQGTVTVLSQGEPVEVTTFRTDGEYHDHRRPEQVRFVSSLKEDLSRRDFTVNTLCFNEKEGLVDLFGGTDDIKNKIIRCVGEPDRRFNEDALRIIRALRFSSVLDFEIEEKTSQSIIKNKALLGNIAVERVRDELTKLICGKNAFKVIMNYHEVLEEIIPELSALYGCEQNTNYHLYDVYEHTALALSSIENDKMLRLTMLLHDIAKPLCKTTDLNGVDHFKGHAYLGEAMARDILKRLRYDNATVNRVSHLVGLHSERAPKSKIEAKLMLCEIGVDDYKAFMKIRRADCLAKANPHSHDEKLKNMQAFLDEIEKNNECWSLAQLKINGNDLKQLGFKSGKKLSAVLRALLFEVIEEEIPNDSEELKKRACELL